MIVNTVEEKSFKNSFSWFVLFASFALPLFGFMCLYESAIGDIVYYNKVVYGLSLSMLFSLSFYISRVASLGYKKNKDVRLFFLSLAFHVIGFVSFLHALLLIPFFEIHKSVFAVWEHVGFFFGALVFLGFFIAPKNIKNIERDKNKAFFLATFLILWGFFILVFLPEIAKAIELKINIFIGITGFLFALVSLVFFIRFYYQTRVRILIHLFSGFAILMSTGVIPFFYEEWNIVWWYYHMLSLLAFVVILFGITRSGKQDGGFSLVISDVPFFYRISTKLMVLTIPLSLFPLISFFSYSFYLYEDSLENRVKQDLELLAEFKEKQVLTYFERMGDRVVDLSSDKFIGDVLSSMESASEEDLFVLEETLNDYLTRQLVRNSNIYGINIINTEGMVIASTEEGEIGKNKTRADYFRKTMYTPHGSFQIGNIMDGDHSYMQKNIIMSSSILVDEKTGRKLGVLVNFFTTEMISNLLLGNDRAGFEHFDMFLVNENKQIISSVNSDLYLKEIKSVDSVNKCLKYRQETTGLWLNYEDKSVYGASACLSNYFNWVVLVEVPQAVVLLEVNSIKKNLMFLILLLSICVILLAIYISRKIVLPIRLLSDTTKKMSYGDYDLEVPILSKDEVGLLAENFNTMTHSIKSSNIKIVKHLHSLKKQKKQLGFLMKDLEKFKLAVENVSDQIVITDPNGLILYANKALEDITEYKVSEIIGKKNGGRDLWGGLMPDKFYAKLWKEVKEKKKVFFCELQNHKKSGEVYNAEVHIYPILNSKKEVQFFVVVERDITKAKEVDRMKTEFVSLASHQLRTPLSAINWYTEMLLAGDAGELSEEQKQYLDEIYNGNQRMVVLVNSLLNVSRIELGTMPVELELLNIKEIVQSVLGELVSTIKEKKMKVDLIYDKKVPLVKMDRKLMRIIFQNLLSNAVKYTPEKGTVQCIVKKNVASFSIDVSDTGYGIPKSQVHKIFSKLFRADNVRAKDVEGNGLGLYLVKAIVEGMGGKISFKSVENKGSTFSVIIPIKGCKKCIKKKKKDSVKVKRIKK
ncbi:PAS domain S-box protein [Candidatus Gracilibacteria bacterium]|nr:PAS domain S-box protein [Candidatus Gracilibacteria bacterium]